ncbi:MAG: hypothetical protein CMB25_07480 [Euryarchaeota archaeon]|nr:hypothetical protein [Euryarchaeota archaeon]MAY05418.1 hypothetical protein [Euryarchaeota archaeon]|tara:strand:- start:9800 stop:10186 length:387 start_codon:yes stop_codon:yes gene_type:complete
MEEESNFMPNMTTAYGIALTLWGLIVTWISEAQSISSFAPALFGLPLLVSGEMAKTPEANRKLWMHVAVTFGLLAALGGTRFFMVMSDGLNYASTSMLMLFATGSIYTFLCVRSFIEVRKSRGLDASE